MSRPRLHLDADAARRVCSGQAIQVRESERVSLAEENSGPRLARAYGPNETFLALVAHVPEADAWRPHKVFAALPDIGQAPER